MFYTKVGFFTEVQRFRGAKVQRFRGFCEVQRFKGVEVLEGFWSLFGDKVMGSKVCVFVGRLLTV